MLTVFLINSWVQTQLKNHPDELWEDGLRDYLDHASIIMVKFSDVVNWLKANATKGENLVADVGASFAGKKILSEVTNKENNSLGEKNWVYAEQSKPFYIWKSEFNFL
ncbi:PREDICTED: uncharacterized protein LOC109348943 [Lupinus angustifolius]|uniref:uncharacterized protein LOC109348943 n=1 Tax=Lupinus angustifolius TaxID=3871 RepID=UPI00092E541C|nr:PREDICTED: uncharacterized protein LOC109348943 [Lupinus angustifolius]